MTRGLFMLVCFLTGFSFSLVALAVGLDIHSRQYMILLAAVAVGASVLAKCAPRD
jgi:putative Mn2+ efflux pump MntP